MSLAREGSLGNHFFREDGFFGKTIDSLLSFVNGVPSTHNNNMTNAAPTVALTTILIEPPITIFAAVLPTPRYGDVWVAFTGQDGLLAFGLDPNFIITAPNDGPYAQKFEVDPGFEAVTWFARGNMPQTLSIPRATLSPPPKSETSQGLSAPLSSVTGGESSGSQAGAPSSDSISRTGPASNSPTSGQTGLQDPTAKEYSSKSNIGPIVGGVVGGIAVLAAIIFLVWFLLRRRKRKQILASTIQRATSLRHDDDLLAHRRISELPYIPDHHELDPAKGNTAVMRANELEIVPGHGEAITRPLHVQELAGGAQGQEKETEWRQGLGEDKWRDGVDGAQQAQPPQQDASPYVEAQRRLEMDWLEREEARLRSRRELLRQQQQGGGQWGDVE